MQNTLKPSNNVKPLSGLSVAQKLEVYQIIASAETGDTKSVIDRAKKLLAAAKESAELPDHYKLLVSQHSVSEILEMACRAQGAA